MSHEGALVGDAVDLHLLDKAVFCGIVAIVHEYTETYWLVYVIW